MPVNPPRQLTKSEEAKAQVDEAWADTRRFVYRHSLLTSYVVIGTIVLAVNVVTGYPYTDVMLLGYWFGGISILLDYFMRAR